MHEQPGDREPDMGKRSGSTAQPFPPITSTPAGGVNSNTLSASSGLTTTFVSAIRVTWFNPSTSSSRRGAVPVEADRHGPEIGRAGLRLELHPLKAVAHEGLHDVEPVAHIAIAGEQHRGARADGIVERRDGHLREVDVVHPDLLAVGDDDELGRLRIAPAEAVGPLKRQRAGLRLHQVLVGRVRLLLEVRGETANAAQESVQRRGTVLVRALGLGARALCEREREYGD